MRNRIFNTGWNRFFSPDDHVLALPSWNAPRLLLVSRSIRQRWKDSSTYYPAFRFRAQLFKLALRFSVALFPSLFTYKTLRLKSSGLSHEVARLLDRYFKSFRYSSTGQSLFPGYFHAQGVLSHMEEWTVDDQLRGELLGFIRGTFPNQARCVLLTGSTAHDKRKLIVQVHDRWGMVLGYLKYGEKPPAQACIRHEADCLLSLPVGVSSSCLGFLKKEEYACMALSPVEGKLLPAKLPADWSSLVTYLNQLERLEGFAAKEHPFIVRLKKQSKDMIPEQQWAEWLQTLGGKSWATVFQHGDFAPWNVFRLPSSSIRKNSSLATIDWEEGVDDGFPHMDLAYYCLQTGYLMHFWPAPVAANYAARILNKYGLIAMTAAHVIVRISALDAWLRNESSISGSELQQFRKDIWSAPLEVEKQV
jgi:hypothetical protein